MQCDELIWKTIAFNFCSFKVKTETQNFCKNEYNLTGLCSRQSCPLANSTYATTREEKGEIYLYKKTIERAHLPSQLWEKTKLDKNFVTSLKQIDEELEYSSDFLIQTNKQRLTKLFQMLTRKRKLVLKTKKKLIGINKKVERREAARERKAEMAARLEKTIEKELLERLKKGVYDGVMNTGKEFANALDQMEHQVDEEIDEEELEFEEDFSEDEELENASDSADSQEFVTDDSDDSDVSAASSDSKIKKKPRKSNIFDNVEHISIEYEHEQEMIKNW
jgi:protein MAK16